MSCCISFESYIKPQPPFRLLAYHKVVYLLNPTSNHNGGVDRLSGQVVVYLLNPTSNHNYRCCRIISCSLYIFWILHQTTTCWRVKIPCHQLYIFWILHQTTTVEPLDICRHLLYIFWILHQTTTNGVEYLGGGCCISFESYIKPQLFAAQRGMAQGCISFESYIKPQHSENFIYSRCVVYLLNPTSNHN